MRKNSHFFLYQKRSVTPKYAKNAFRAGAPPVTPMGAHMLPGLISGLGKGNSAFKNKAPTKKIR